MIDWPIDRDLDERLRRVVNAEIAAADPRQILTRTRRSRSASRLGAGIAILAAIAIVVALVWRSQTGPVTGGPSETPGITPTAAASGEPSGTPTAEPTASPTPAPTAQFTPGPTADLSLGSGRKPGCPRERSVAVTLASGKVLIAGGCTPTDDTGRWNLASAELFDPATGLFTPTGSMTAERDLSSAILLPDGRVLFVGWTESQAWASDQPATDDLYDPATGRFTPVGPVVKMRAGAGTALLPDGRVLIAAGDQDTRTTDTAEIYDPATRSFVSTGEMAPGNMSVGGPASAVSLADGRVLVLGSIFGTSGQGGFTLLAQVFDPATGRFTASESTLPSGLVLAAGLPDGRVMVVSGEQGGAVEAYDPSTDTFSRLASMPKPMSASTCTVLADGRILLLGTVLGDPQPDYGNRFDPSSGLFDRLPASGRDRQSGHSIGPMNISGELYDPASNSWTVLGHLNRQRGYFSVAALQNGGALILGGDADDEAELFDPSTGRFVLNE
jgi:hypothetical protein